jgi:hypothetical protein
MPQGGHPPHHSITSSARARSVGVVKPSALPVANNPSSRGRSAPAPSRSRLHRRGRHRVPGRRRRMRPTTATKLDSTGSDPVLTWADCPPLHATCRKPPKNGHFRDEISPETPAWIRTTERPGRRPPAARVTGSRVGDPPAKRIDLIPFPGSPARL